MRWAVLHPDGGVTRYERERRGYLEVYHRTARGHTFDWTQCSGCPAVLYGHAKHHPDCTVIRCDCGHIQPCTVKFCGCCGCEGDYGDPDAGSPPGMVIPR
jgi:hypothetical protein